MTTKKEAVFDLTKIGEYFDIDGADNDLRLEVEINAQDVRVMALNVCEPWFAYQLGFDGAERETVEKFKQCAEAWAKRHPEFSMEWSDIAHSSRSKDEVDSEDGEVMSAIVCFPKFILRISTTQNSITNAEVLTLAQPLLKAYKDFEDKAGDIMAESRKECIRTVLHSEPVTPEEEDEITTDVVGFTYQADTYCVACGSKLPKTDPEGNEKHAMLANDEYETQPHCCQCGEEIDVNVIFDTDE